MIKVAAARMACKVVDCAIQVHGGAGVSGDVPLAQMYVFLTHKHSYFSFLILTLSMFSPRYSYARTLRLADGPDEVHLSSIALLELRDQLKKAQAKLWWPVNQGSTTLFRCASTITSLPSTSRFLCTSYLNCTTISYCNPVLIKILFMSSFCIVFLKNNTLLGIIFIVSYKNR